MNNLLIVGAGTYAVVAYEIAADMGCFDKIAFVDDERTTAPNGISVVGTIRDVERLFTEYNNVIVAIGNSKARLSLLEQLKDMSFSIATLISPKAYVSASANIQSGCIIEPMAVVHTACFIAEGCIISAGAVINHASMCCSGVHIDCNATVDGYCLVPLGTKVDSSGIYNKRYVNGFESLLFNQQQNLEILKQLSVSMPAEIETTKKMFD